MDLTLVKFCKPEHNILNKCHKIRFGTLQNYREMDPSFTIADQDEGLDYTYIHHADSDNASPEVKNTIPLLGNPKTTIHHSKKINAFPNCYIWCCSRSTKPVPPIMGSTLFDKEYTSCYEITNATLFSEYLTALLMNYITNNNFVDPVKNILQNLSVREMTEVSLHAFHYSVAYVQEKISEIDKGQLTTYVNNNVPENLRPLFTKSNKYNKENEYRFVFLFHHPRHGFLQVRKDPVDVPILPIADIRESK